VTGTYNSKARRRRIRRSKSFRWSVAAVVLGSLLLLGAGVASAAIVLHGRGMLNVPAYHEQGLQVSAVRLTGPLVPGESADLQFSVRNPNTFTVRVAGVTLIGALRKAKPAGCVTKVTGPVTKPAGYRLPASEQVLVAAGLRADVVVHNAFKLAASATKGCGFTVDIDVQGIQQASPTTPETTAPTPPPASPSPSQSASSSPTQPPATVPPTIVVPGLPDIDPADQ
jgi:hypothetical protein